MGDVFRVQARRERRQGVAGSHHENPVCATQRSFMLPRLAREQAAAASHDTREERVVLPYSRRKAASYMRKIQAVRDALKEFIRLRRKEELLALRGRLEIEDNWRQLRESQLKEA
jgi:hypothetical protein